MRKPLVLALFGILLTVTSGCNLCPCLREAWGNCFGRRQQPAMVAEPACVVTDPCSTAVISGAPAVVTPGVVAPSAGCGCSGGMTTTTTAPATMPGVTVQPSL